ncbi:prepilin-type N-terminal cleavage/methylation domain-containing protein [Desulfurispirillum indicum]|uniref:type II secretion system protein n=1 Tax=Desulfurispirillum indicum TaxID=936456 RepID=UPI001CFA94D5|nr:prepilin-type N-terminal cleavage/methylation domain-containing protein [Desulfurispirillum indicum]UCZ56882.1 prepilin-type N-terminal cleavage/methylation domain-containing protein [Desulfurispirillum indicum]
MKNRMAGFTLFEVIMTLTIIGVLFAASAPLLRNAIESYFLAREMSDDLLQLNIAMERMTQEIRGSEVDSAAGNTALALQTDDGLVCFAFSGGRIVRGMGISAADCATHIDTVPLTGAILGGVGNHFSYYNFGASCDNLTVSNAVDASVVTLNMQAGSYSEPFRTSVYVQAQGNSCFN